MDLAAQEINIKDIVIQDSFKASPPSTYKIAKCYGYYRKNNAFDRDIIINKDNVLTDGYVAYLVAKMFDIKMVHHSNIIRTVYVWDNAKTPYRLIPMRSFALKTSL